MFRSMAGVSWTRFEQAIVIYFNNRGYLDKILCRFLRRIANTKRSITAVRSQLAELRKNPAFYDVKQKMWTTEAERSSYGRHIM